MSFALQILSSGKFTLGVASSISPNITQANTLMLIIANSVSNIIVNPSVLSPVVYFDFNVLITVLGRDNNTYLGNCPLTLYYNSKNISYALITTGSYKFTVHLNTFTSSAFVASCANINGASEIITPSEEKLMISGLSLIPITSNQAFSLTVNITDGFGNLENAKNNPAGHVVSLSLIPMKGNSYSGTVLGGNYHSISSTGGIYAFTGLKVLS